MSDALSIHADIHLKKLGENTPARPIGMPTPAYNGVIKSDNELAMISESLGHTAKRINLALQRADSTIQLDVREVASPPAVNVVFTDLAHMEARTVWNTLSVSRHQTEVTVSKNDQPSYSFRDCDDVTMLSDLIGAMLSPVMERLPAAQAKQVAHNIKRTKRTSDLGHI